jgi:hypothetical protein
VCSRGTTWRASRAFPQLLRPHCLTAARNMANCSRTAVSLDTHHCQDDRDHGNGCFKNIARPLAREFGLLLWVKQLLVVALIRGHATDPSSPNSTSSASSAPVFGCLCVFWCNFKAELVGNLFRHNGQIWSRPPVWIFMWPFKVDLTENLRGQRRHLNGKSKVWSRKWRHKSDGFLNSFVQKLQRWTFPPSDDFFTLTKCLIGGFRALSTRTILPRRSEKQKYIFSNFDDDAKWSFFLSQFRWIFSPTFNQKMSWIHDIFMIHDMEKSPYFKIEIKGPKHDVNMTWWHAKWSFFWRHNFCLPWSGLSAWKPVNSIALNSTSSWSDSWIISDLTSCCSVVGTNLVWTRLMWAFRLPTFRNVQLHSSHFNIGSLLSRQWTRLICDRKLPFWLKPMWHNSHV